MNKSKMYKGLPENPFTWAQRTEYNFFQFLDHFIGRPIVVKMLGKERMRLFKSISKTLEKRGTSNIVPIERRTDLSFEELKNEYILKARPVVWEGGAKHWPCVSKWTPEWVKEQYGNDEVPILDAIYTENGIEYMKLGKIIDEILEGKNSYFRFYNLLARHPECYKDFDNSQFENICHFDAYTKFTQVFIGGPNSMTGMHNSHADNLFVQVYGEKHWILYPNYFVPLIDPPSTMSGTYRITPRRGEAKKPFNGFTPDYDTYPLYKYIDGYEVKLKPGDLFYNPPYMWHTVMNPTASIGLALRWVSPTNSMRVSALYYLLDLLAYRPSYFRAFRWYKSDSNAEFVYMQKMLEKQKRRMEKRQKKMLAQK